MKESNVRVSPESKVKEARQVPCITKTFHGLKRYAGITASTRHSNYIGITQNILIEKISLIEHPKFKRII